MVKFKLLTTILTFVTLVTALVTCLFFIGACFKCQETYWYGQLNNNVIYGLFILIALLCVIILTKEEVPKVMLITWHIISAVLYFAVMVEIIIFINSLNSRLQICWTFLPGLTGALHLTLALLYIFRKNLDTGSE